MNRLPRTICNTKNVKQAVRSTDSVWNIRVLHFEFVSNFEIRISDFEFRHL